MAIYRSVSMSFWTDSKVVDDFTPEDRYFYLYLFTNPHTNLCGCFEISLKQAALETGYSKDSIENLIKRFESVHNLIRYSKETKEILIVNWSKYNWTLSDKFRKPLFNQINDVKNDEFRSYLMNLYNGADTVSIPYKYGIDTSDTVTVTDTVTDTKENTLEQEFEEIWKLYPRKQGKEKAKNAYIRAVKKGTEKAEVIRGVVAYTDYIKRNKIEPKYIKMGSTFFNNKSWQDEFTDSYKNSNAPQRDYNMQELEGLLLQTN